MADPEGEPGSADGTVAWREVLADTTARLSAVGLPAAEARWIVEEVAGVDAGLDTLVTERGMAAHDRLVARRLAGEPLQYVLGHWPFRGLDLMVDHRVLIPRPETEVVAGFAIDEVDRLAGGFDGPVLVADLGTGSGAIGLAVAVERVDTSVWCTDRSAEALAVARANLAGVGRPAARVTMAEGCWFDALPADLAGRLGVVVSNPPYVGDGEDLPAEVAAWEPPGALRSGPDGGDDLRLLIDEAPVWLAPGGALVLELSPDQAAPMANRADDAGYVDVAVRHDLTGRHRALIARVG
jgi:release factor glutamine methyltransferase